MFKAMNSSILVINCGSSSLKFALIDSASHEAVMTGLAEKLGLADACITFKHNGDKQTALLSALTTPPPCTPSSRSCSRYRCWTA